MTRPLMLVLLVITLSGCAGLAHREERVKINIVDMEMLDSTLMEQRFLVRLRVQNRQQSALAVKGMSFDVELNGSEFASGVSNQHIEIPAFDDGIVEVKVSSSFFGIVRQVMRAKDRQGMPFQYLISGRVYAVDSFLSYPFEESGEIDLRGSANPAEHQKLGN